jgi:uncharacterized protein YbjT (DUF2867 family)
MPTAPDVFVTGATGYIGRPLVSVLVARGHRVRALARPASRARVPAGAEVAPGDALDAGSYAHHVPRGAVFVHLVGTPHPNPSRAAEFRRVDLASVSAAVFAATAAAASHFVYVSVAQPAPAMQAYVAARAAGEAAISGAGLTATFVRPWYVLGPGHRWPLLLLPAYALARALPATRATAERLGLVTLAQMLAALVAAVEAPPGAGQRRIVDVAAIRNSPPLATR